MKYIEYLIENAFKDGFIDPYLNAIVAGINQLEAEKQIVLINLNQISGHEAHSSFPEVLAQSERLICLVISPSPATPIKTFNYRGKEEKLSMHTVAASIDFLTHTIEMRDSLYSPAGIHNFRLFRDEKDVGELNGVYVHKLYDSEGNFLAHQFEPAEWVRKALQGLVSDQFRLIDCSVPQQLTKPSTFPVACPESETNCVLWGLINAMYFYQGKEPPVLPLEKVALQRGGLLKYLAEETSTLSEIKEQIVIAIKACVKNYLAGLEKNSQGAEKKEWLEKVKQYLTEKTLSREEFEALSNLATFIYDAPVDRECEALFTMNDPDYVEELSVLFHELEKEPSFSLH